MINLKKTIFTIVVLIFFCTLMGCGAKVEDSNTVFTVNGAEVSIDEFSMGMKKRRAEVLSYYYQTYKAEKYDEEFWNTDFGGGDIPLVKLKEYAKDDVILKKIILSYGAQSKYIESANFSAIENMRLTENSGRENKLISGELMIGKTAFTSEEYYDYLISNISIKLRDEWFSGKIEHSELIEYYDKMKNTLFLAKDTKEVIPFDEVISKVDQLCAQDKFDEKIQSESENAKLVYNQTVYDDIKI